MNIKTTVGLTIAAIVICSAYLIWSSRPIAVIDELGDSDSATQASAIGEGGPSSSDTGYLTQPPFSDDTRIVKIAYQPGQRAQMVFERVPGESTTARKDDWMMVQPTRCRATGWTVNNMILAIKGLKSAMKYTLGTDDAPTLEQAGLRPHPAARFAVTSEDGRTVEVELGNTLVGQSKRYVFLPGKPDDLFVADADFNDILNRKPTEYREKNMFRFVAASAVELEVVERRDGQSTKYQFTKTGDDWQFVEPFEAKAQGRKIQDVVKAVGRLWVPNWLEQVPDNLAEFGLEVPYLRITVVTEKAIEKPSDDEFDEANEPEPTQDEQEDGPAEEEAEQEIVREEFVLMLSDRSPIDNDQQIYVKRGEDEQVGMVNATELKKFVPDPIQWRDMRIAKLAAAQADSMKIESSSGTIEFELRNGDWYFADSEEQAEPMEVGGLIASLAVLEAVNFVDGGQPGSFGLDQPAAEITLGFPGSTEVQILRIGDFTEQVEKRLRYVQRVGSTSIAKVRSKELDKAFQNQQQFRNREIMNYQRSRLLKIELARHLPAAGSVQHITLERDKNQVWQMTVPTIAEVDLKPVNELVEMLAHLRCTSILDELNPDALGLVKPDIQLVVTIEGIPTIRISDAESDKDSPSQELIPSAAIIRQVNFSKQGENVYAHRLDRPVFMQLEADIYDALMAEFLEGDIWDFEPSTIVAFGSVDAERSPGTHPRVEIRKDRGRWQYSLEPDIPIDSTKVEKHIEQMKNLKTRRFVDYNAADLSNYGLDSPGQRIFFETEGAGTHELLVSKMPYRGEGQRYYAVVAGTNRVFVIGPSTLDLGVINLSRFERD